MGITVGESDAGQADVHLEEILERTSVLGRTTTSIVLSSPVRRKPLLPPALP